MPGPNLPSSIGIIGGTGPQGRGLGLRMAAAGLTVVLGSRSADRARAAALELAPKLECRPEAGPITGADNAAAAEQAELVVISVPYDGHDQVIKDLAAAMAGKTVVDVVVPLRPPDVTVARPPAAGSAAVEAQLLLGSKANVVGAFHNLSALKLRRLDAAVDCDVLVCGDEEGAKATVLALAEAMGLVAYDAGALSNAGVLEGLTAVLLGINRRHGAKSAGIRITNVARPGGGELASPG